MAVDKRRRALIGLGVGGVVAAGLGTAAYGQASARTPEPSCAPTEASILVPEHAPTNLKQAAKQVNSVYKAESAAAGGWWKAHITVFDSDGNAETAVERDSDDLVEAWSVNKMPVAIALLDKVDRGELSLDDQVEVPESLVSYDGDGVFGWDGAYPSKVTLGHVLCVMLTVSDNTAVRLCGQVVDGDEINSYWSDQGFVDTRVQPNGDDPKRFFLGTTTPKEQHDIWRKTAVGELVSDESRDYLFSALRAPVAFSDGIRLHLSTKERMRIATKAGWFDTDSGLFGDDSDERCEAGIIYDSDDRPALIYSIYAGEHGVFEDFGAAHPANRARANMGWAFKRIMDGLRGDL
ncbi:MAG: serine hydrolase [Stackebrandtia sp.]